MHKTFRGTFILLLVMLNSALIFGQEKPLEKSAFRSVVDNARKNSFGKNHRAITIYEIFENGEAKLAARPGLKKTLYFASSSEKGIAEASQRFALILSGNLPKGLSLYYENMREEKHSTIYHPAALRAFRLLFKPVETK